MEPLGKGKENAMKKTLSFLSLAVMSVALHAQTPASPQIPDPAMTPGTTQSGTLPQATTDAPTPQQHQRVAQVQAASVAAELTNGVDTKRAKVGDRINAKTTSEAKLPDGTVLSKGTKLVGNVVEVTSKSKEQKNSHLVIALNRAMMKDGDDMPIRAAVTSVTAPAAQQTMDLPSGGGAAPAGGGGADSSGGGSVPARSAPTMADGMTNQADSAQGAMLKSASDHVPVGNMPNVVLSAATTPDSAGVLDAQNQNISLESGTKLTVNVSSALRGQ
jgi:hypothetical protein